MVALAEVLDGRLPVRIHVPSFPVGELERPNIRAVLEQLLFKRRCKLAQRRCIGVEIHPHKTGELLDCDFIELEVILAEILHVLAVASRANRAVKVVGPGVIGAGEEIRLTGVVLNNRMGAVETNVVVALELTRFISGNDNLLLGNVDLYVLAWLLDLADVACKVPGALKDQLLVLFVHLRRVVALGRKRVRKFRVIRIEDACVCIHDVLPFGH